MEDPLSRVYDRDEFEPFSKVEWGFITASCIGVVTVPLLYLIVSRIRVGLNLHASLRCSGLEGPKQSFSNASSVICRWLYPVLVEYADMNGVKYAFSTKAKLPHYRCRLHQHIRNYLEWSVFSPLAATIKLSPIAPFCGICICN